MKALVLLIAMIATSSLFRGVADAHDLSPTASLGTLSPNQNSCPDTTPAEPFAEPGSGYQRKYNTIGHRLLDDEVGAGDVTPTMYSILDALIDEAVGSLPVYSNSLTAAQEAVFAKEVLNKTDCILLRHRFVYPGHGLVQLLSDALGPTIYD
jgi:hypothetical protein